MCGIAGIARTEPLTDGERRALTPMLDRIAHRGPDDAGRFDAPHVALGHRRLSIIDLQTGRQPLSNERGTIHTIVNGEFYNYRTLRDELKAAGHWFNTRSDSECLPHLYEAYGDTCVERLDGMFAFALWDASKRSLLLARDRLGVKPLYYHFDGRRLIFASEMKSILAVPGVRPEVDATALADYLTYSFIPSPKTILHGVRKLEPGCVLRFADGRITIRRYWDLNFRGRRGDSGERIINELWSVLQARTRARLMADVPLGAFLSAGIDSSAVVAAMKRVSNGDVITMTCGFDERGFDERAAARDTAGLLHCDHHEDLVQPHAAEIVDTFCHHFDEPFADASAIPTYYLSQFARRFVKVVLSGDGGDEALAGYRRYRFDQYEEAVRRCLPGFLRRGLIAPLAAMYPSRAWMPQVLRAGATLRNLAADAPTAHALSVSTLAPREVSALLSRDIAREIDDYDPLDHARERYHRCDAPDHLSKCQYVDMKLGLTDGILTKVDRASMAHALEVRSPMLDHRFWEFAWSIPPKWRIRDRAGKYPLRRLVERHVNARVARRPKTGFEVPLDAWFRGPLRDRFSDELLGPNALLRAWFEPKAIKRVWRDHLAGRHRHGPTLWKLAMFEAWCRRYLHASSAPREETATIVQESPVCTL